MKNSQRFITYLSTEIIGIALLTLLWLAMTLFYPAYIVPTPWSVLTDFRNYLPVDFGQQALTTLYRTLIGFILAMMLGTLSGILAHVKHWDRAMNSIMLAIQVLPAMILGVIFLLIFGLGDLAPILLVTFLTMPTLAINTIHGLAKKDVRLQQYLVSLNAGRTTVLRFVYLPALIPVIQSNISLGMGMAIKVVIMGEFIGAQDGIGYLLNNARLVFNMKEVFFYLAFILLITLVFQALQSLIFNRFFQKYYYPG